MTEQELQAIEAKVADREARASAATRGPYSVGHDRHEQATIHSGDEWLALLPHQCVESVRVQRERDAAFIAAARTDVPDACAEERSLIAEIRRVRALAEGMAGIIVAACDKLGIDPVAVLRGDSAR